MSRIVLATFGSLGDLHPFLALAETLAARGHHPVVAASPSYRERVMSFGFEFAPLSPDFSRWEHDPLAMRRAMDLRGGSEWIYRNMVAPYIRQTGPELLAACEGADAIVNSTLVFAAAPVAEKFGLPRVAVTLQPSAMFSAVDPPQSQAMPLASAALGWSPPVARALFAFARATTRRWFAPVAELRRSLGLPNSSAHPLFDAGDDAALHLALFSEHFAPDPGDWPANALQCGFAYFDRAPEHDAVPAEVRAFLEAGEPPIVFTLGSAAVWVAGSFYEEAFQAARALNCRAVLLTGDRPENVPSERHPDVCVAGYAPYSKLFPHAAAIVHQGGIGTTAQALRAGKPQLIVPWSHDQPDNAARCERLGVARVVPRSRADADTLEHGLRALLADRGAAASAAALGDAIRAEDGAGAAADAVIAAITSAPVLLGDLERLSAFAPPPKRREPASWPMILVASLSIIPCLGVLFGSGAVTWGLLSRRRHSNLAIGIGAAGALLQFVAVVLFSIYAAGQKSSEPYYAARAIHTQQALDQTMIEVERYRALKGRYPVTLEALTMDRLYLHGEVVSAVDPYAASFPASATFGYRTMDDRRAYDLWSRGPDGKSGTADDMRPRVPDSLAARTGFRPQLR